MIDYADLARRAAEAGGRVLMTYFRRPFQIWKKGAVDLLTEADLASETTVKAIIREACPDHAILAEETSSKTRSDDACWIIDPLDGTTNFAHGYPFFCVSIALYVNHHPKAAAVFAPAMGELFWAADGEGSFLNGDPIRVSTIDDINDAMLVTGFPYDLRRRQDDTLNLFSRYLMVAQAVRRDGSAALNLCYLAAGRFDGFWERGLQPWDTAAGALIVREAGGTLSQMNGSDFDPFIPDLLASNGHLHAAMRRIADASHA